MEQLFILNEELAIITYKINRLQKTNFTTYVLLVAWLAIGILHPKQFFIKKSLK